MEGVFLWNFLYGCIACHFTLDKGTNRKADSNVSNQVHSCFVKTLKCTWEFQPATLPKQ